ncbi:hypothetical protein ABBQ38_006493 [Trebouxia sp. C0009 RCD-2024]
MLLTGFPSLVTLCVLTFVGSMLAGLAPLFLGVSESHLQTISAVGAGLLIGTALEVILPEGSEAFGTARQDGGNEQHLPESLLGAALISGFVIMLLLDQVHTAVSMSFQTSPPPANNGSEDPGEVQELLEAQNGLRKKHVLTKTASDPAARAYIGLMVHSAADGFAVGAATRSDSSALGVTIAIAMVLHKAPVAFGLATSFMAANWTWQKSQKALLAFCSTSPLAALITYALIGATPALSSASSTALCVLFSGGTVLYAACMHVVPQVVGHDAALDRVQLAAVVCGSVLPLLLTLAMPHAH